MLEVIDYGGGNLGSLCRALDRLGLPYQTIAGSHDGRFPTGESPLILPGVGAFGALMQALTDRQLVVPIQQAVAQGTPLLGVCVGLQVLFESSEESPDVDGLGLLKGTVVKLDDSAKKVPQIGWNEIHAKQPDWPNGFVYYVNSYVARPQDSSVLLYESTYQDETFCGAVRYGAVTAFQFHPEKSGDFGHQLIAKWWELIQPVKVAC